MSQIGRRIQGCAGRSFFQRGGAGQGWKSAGRGGVGQGEDENPRGEAGQKSTWISWLKNSKVRKLLLRDLYYKARQVLIFAGWGTPFFRRAGRASLVELLEGWVKSVGELNPSKLCKFSFERCFRLIWWLWWFRLIWRYCRFWCIWWIWRISPPLETWHRF